MAEATRLSREEKSPSAKHLPPDVSPCLTENADLPGAATFLSLQSESGARGRHVITEQEVKPGELLFSENPFASVQLAEHSATHCHHCYAKLQVPFPCTRCTQPRYCSETCRDESWATYHRFECGSLDFLHSVGVAHLATRTLIVAGRKRLVEKLRTDLTDRANLRVREGKEDGYGKVLNLVDHCDKIHPFDLFQYAITATLLTSFLEQRTKFFSPKSDVLSKPSFPVLPSRDPVQVDEDTSTFVGALALKHILQLICNASAIYEVGPGSPSDSPRNGLGNDISSLVYNTVQFRVATAIFPSASMMNHSCDPSVINSFYKNRIVVKAIKHMAEGEEIFNCYGPDFRRMNKEDRQASLKFQYRFSCSCVKCKGNGRVEVVDDLPLLKTLFFPTQVTNPTFTKSLADFNVVIVASRR